MQERVMIIEDEVKERRATLRQRALKQRMSRATGAHRGFEGEELYFKRHGSELPTSVDPSVCQTLSMKKFIPSSISKRTRIFVSCKPNEAFNVILNWLDERGHIRKFNKKSFTLEVSLQNDESEQHVDDEIPSCKCLI